MVPIRRRPSMVVVVLTELSKSQLLSLTGCGHACRGQHKKTRQCGSAKPEATDPSHWAKMNPGFSSATFCGRSFLLLTQPAHTITLSSAAQRPRSAAKSLLRHVVCRLTATRVRLSGGEAAAPSHHSGMSGASRTFPADPLIPKCRPAITPSRR